MVFEELKLVHHLGLVLARAHALLQNPFIPDDHHLVVRGLLIRSHGAGTKVAIPPEGVEVPFPVALGAHAATTVLLVLRPLHLPPRGVRPALTLVAALHVAISRLLRCPAGAEAEQGVDRSVGAPVNVRGRSTGCQSPPP